MAIFPGFRKRATMREEQLNRSRAGKRFSGAKERVAPNPFNKIAREARAFSVNRAVPLMQERNLSLKNAMQLMRSSEQKFRGALDWSKEQLAERTQEMSREEKEYNEYLRLNREHMEVAQQEELIQKMEMNKLEREELVRQSKMHLKLVEILMKKGMGRGQAIEVAKELVVSIRGLKQQEAITEQNYKKLLENENLLHEIAETAAKQLNDKRVMHALLTGGVNKTELVAQVLQQALEANKLIEPQQ